MGVLILLIITFMIMWFLAGVFTATHFDQQRRFRHWSVLTVFFPIFVPIVVIICQDIYASQHPHYTSYKTVIDLGALTQWIGAVVGSFLLSILIAFFVSMVPFCFGPESPEHKDGDSNERDC